MELNIEKLNMHFDSFVPDGQFVWRLAAAMRDIRMLDHLPDMADNLGKVNEKGKGVKRRMQRVREGREENETEKEKRKEEKGSEGKEGREGKG